MTPQEFEQVWEAAKKLTPDEMRRVRELLDSMMTRTGEFETPESRLDLILLQEGIISRIPNPMTDWKRYRDWTPVKIDGKPASDTIIKERR